MSQYSLEKILVTTALVITVGVLGYYAFNAPDTRDTRQKVGDALHALPEGVDKAAQQFESRTPGEKFGDVVQDVGDEIKESTGQQ